MDRDMRGLPERLADLLPPQFDADMVARFFAGLAARDSGQADAPDMPDLPEQAPVMALEVGDAVLTGDYAAQQVAPPTMPEQAQTEPQGGTITAATRIDQSGENAHDAANVGGPTALPEGAQAEMPDLAAQARAMANLFDDDQSQDDDATDNSPAATPPGPGESQSHAGEALMQLLSTGTIDEHAESAINEHALGDHCGRFEEDMLAG